MTNLVYLVYKDDTFFFISFGDKLYRLSDFPTS